ncbi:MerR family transcriptional regulator [Chloroflexota bacterium]
MITTNELIAITQISYPRLNRLKELGILPKPKLTSQGRGKGVMGEYEDDVVEIINRVNLLKRQGVKLSDIAEIIKSEFAEIKTFKPSEEYLIPINTDSLQSYLSAYENLHNWFNMQINKNMPGYEFHSVVMEKVVKQDADYLTPKEIKVKPMVIAKKVAGSNK